MAFALPSAARFALAALPQESATIAGHRASLLQGMTQFEAVGTPSGLTLYEPQAFAVVVAGNTGDLKIPVAASGMGLGRVVAFGQTYVDAYDPIPSNIGLLLRNAVQWSNPGRTPALGVITGFNANGAVQFFRQQGFAVSTLSTPISSSTLSSVNTLVLDANKLASNAEADLVREFVRRGGALLISANGWAWPVYTAPGKSLKTDFLGNRLLIEAGIAWTEATVRGSSVMAQLPVSLNSLLALNYLTAGGTDSTELNQAKNTLDLAIRYVPNTGGEPFRTLTALKSSVTAAVPTAAQPFSPARDPLQTLLLNYAANEPVELLTAHPSAEFFPGSVPASAPRISKTVNLNGSTADSKAGRWQSTGLYAPAGERITITLSAEDAKRGLVAIIGVHTDNLNQSLATTWTRAPIVSRSFALTETRNTIASGFGGLLYIRNAATQMSLEIAGAIEAPRFKSRETSLADWKNAIRNLPAPWAELESGSVIATVQSVLIRNLDDPATLLASWDRVLSLQEALAGWNPGENLPQRIVFDQQISLGYMHSGYPVMALLPSQRSFLDFTANASPHDDTWGFMHEFGHNHQSSDWTFTGTTEVTVNLFSMYTLERIYGRPKDEIYSPMMANNVKRRMGAYFAQAPDWSRLSADPFTTLIPYQQLIDAFGWEAFIAVFKEYRGLAEADRPGTDAQKVDQWLTRFSKKVGRNLGTFFQRWGFVTSSAARQSVANLPEWLPEPDFPNAYTNFVDPNVEITGSVKLDSAAGKAVFAHVFRDGQACGVANVVTGNMSCVVPKNWSGTISFKRAGYQFTPASVAMQQVGMDRNIGIVVATTSTAATTSISGRVSASTGPISGAFPMAPGADCSASDENGDYVCVVEAGWSGNISFKKGGHTFAPTFREVADVSSPVHGIDFTAVLSLGLNWKFDCLFNWAETSYAGYFAPGGSPSQTQGPYYYRYYALTSAYLGTNVENGHLYYLGPRSGSTLLDLGAVSSWYKTAACF